MGKDLSKFTAPEGVASGPTIADWLGITELESKVNTYNSRIDTNAANIASQGVTIASQGARITQNEFDIDALQAATPVTNAGAEGVVTAASYTAAKNAVDTATNVVTILGLGTFEATTETVTGATSGSPESAYQHNGTNSLVFEIGTGVFKLFRLQRINGYVLNELLFGGGTGNAQKDTSAITAMLAYGLSLGINSFELLGENVVTVATESAYIFPISHTEFSIRGHGQIAITIDENAGNYRGIFGSASGNNMFLFKAENMRIDKNSANNVIADGSLTTQGRYSFSCYAGGTVDNIHIDGCEFLNSDCVVEIYFPELSGGEINKHAHVTNNLWTNARLGGSGIDYDQSYINISADSGVISQNAFYGESWSRSPRTAIESHIANVVISDNIVKRFQVGMNVCIGLRYSVALDKGVTVFGNSMEVSRGGIYWWPTRFTTPSGGDVVGNGLKISNNHIFVDWEQYTFSFPKIYAIGGFIGSLSSNIKNVEISNNLIIYTPDNAASPALDRSSQVNSSGAIDVNCASNQTISIDGLTIKGNTVVASPCAAVNIEYGVFKNFEATSNTFKNCSSLSSAISSAYQGMFAFIGTLASDAVITGNNFLTETTVDQFYYLRDRGSTVFLFKLISNNHSGTATKLVADSLLTQNRLMIDGGICGDITLPTKAMDDSTIFTTAGRKTIASTIWS